MAFISTPTQPTSGFVVGVLTFIFPPAAVFLISGPAKFAFWLNLVCTLLFFLPGVAHAIWIVTRDSERSRVREEIHRRREHQKVVEALNVLIKQAGGEVPGAIAYEDRDGFEAPIAHAYREELEAGDSDAGGKTSKS